MDIQIRNLERILILNPFDMDARARYLFYQIKTGHFISITKRLAKHRHMRNHNHRIAHPARPKRIKVRNFRNPGKPYTRVVRI